MTKEKCQFEECKEIAVFIHIWIHRGGWVEDLNLCQRHTTHIYNDVLERMVDQSYRIFDINDIKEILECKEGTQIVADHIAFVLKEDRLNKRRDLINKKLKNQEQVDLVL